MHRRVLHILGSVSVVGLLASQAVAGLCYNGVSINPSTGAVVNRAFPAAGTTDTVAMSCNANGGTTTSGSASAIRTAGGTRSLQAQKTGGAAGLGVGVEGLNAAGAVVCDLNDLVADGVFTTAACPSTAVSWRMSESFPG